MDISPLHLATTLLPALPSIILTALLAVLGLTANSTHQDALTQIIVALARPILRTPARVGRSQRVWRWVGWGAAMVMDWIASVGLGWVLGLDGVKVIAGVVRVDVEGRGSGGENGRDGMEKAKDELLVDVGSDDRNGMVMSVMEAVSFAFDATKGPRHGTGISCPTAEVKDVEVEWTTYQGSKSSPASSPSDKTPTIIYLHGGAHCLMDPTTHRWTTGTLSRLANASICSVRFRLSPQNPFPAALIDAFVVYLDLISSSQSILNSPDKSIDPRRIILAGDSSGGGLAASLLLLLLKLSKNRIQVSFRGQTISIPEMPIAGLALTSPWLDITRSLPSTSQNDKWDIIAPPPLDSASPPFPPDDAWPTNPPRAETYCTADICTHPLVSPLAAKSDMWFGAPPVWVCSGWEGFTDEIEVFARRVFQSSGDAKVWFEGWEGMPHCFGMMPWGSSGWEAMHAWTGFCADAVRGKVERRRVGIWRGKVGKARGVMRTVRMDVLGCERDGAGYMREVVLTDEAVDALMERSRSWRMELEETPVTT